MCEQKSKPYVGKNVLHCMHVFGNVKDEANTRKLHEQIRKAVSIAKFWASNGRVGHLSWVPTCRLLAAVGVGALRPVVAAGSSAFLDLVSIHSEFIGAVNFIINAIVSGWS